MISNANIKISFIIAAYNEERYIEECVRSCFLQSHRNVEVCVTDDGSTDNTWAKLKALSLEFQELKISKFSQNRGKVAAFNKSVEMATGAYIAIMGADDVCCPSRIESCLLEIGDCDMIFTNLSRFGPEGVLEKNVMKGLGFKRDKFVAFDYLLVHPVVFGGTLLATRRIIDQIFPLDPRLAHEDWWIPLCAAYQSPIKFGDFISIFYRQHDLQTSGNNVNASKNIEVWRRLISRDIFFYEEVLKKFDLTKSQEIFILRKLVASRVVTVDRFWARFSWAAKKMPPAKWGFRAGLAVFSPTMLFFVSKFRRWFHFRT